MQHFHFGGFRFANSIPLHPDLDPSDCHPFKDTLNQAFLKHKPSLALHDQLSFRQQCEFRQGAGHTACAVNRRSVAVHSSLHGPANLSPSCKE